MFCTNCEFEIKGDDRKECPVCGGPLIDYADVKTLSEEITNPLEPDRWEGTHSEAKETTPFDLGKALEADDEQPVQESEEHISLFSQEESGPQSATTGEERSAEGAERIDFDKSTGESERWEKTRREEKEITPFDLDNALEADDEQPVQESEEYLPLSSLGEPEPQPEAPGEERSAEDAECTDVDKSTGETGRWEETRSEEKEKAPFDLGNDFEVDDEQSVQEPEEYISLFSPEEPEPQPEAPGEERSAEGAECTDVDKSTGESDQWEKIRNAPKEKAPFDLGNDFEVDADTPLQEPEKSIPLFSQSETELESEAADTARSTEEVVPDISESYDTLPEEIIPAAQQAGFESTHASRKQLAISIMGVLALVAAITTIAIFKPQQNLYPDFGHLKTKTEKTVGKILSIITQKEEEKVVAQNPSVQNTRFRQRQRDHAAGNVNPDKKPSRLEKLSSGDKGKGAPVKEQLKTPQRKSLAKQAADHATIASLKETSPLPVGKDIKPFETKRSTQNTLERETAPVMPVVKKTSHSNLYSIHTGSFQNKEVATGEIDRLKKMGFHAYLQTVDLENGETWHRIKIGSYSSREEAENTQNELRQKAPKLKSYIMRRVAEPKKKAMQRKGETSITTAGIAPFVPGQEKREPHHEKPGVLETGPSLQRSLAPEIEQLITEMEGNPFTTLLVRKVIPPEGAGSIGKVPENSAALPLLNENFAPEIEALITGMEGNPFTTLLGGEVIPPEDAGSIGTVPADTHQKEDHLSTGNIVPENTVHEGKEAVTPVE